MWLLHQVDGVKPDCHSLSASYFSHHQRKVAVCAGAVRDDVSVGGNVLHGPGRGASV